MLQESLPILSVLLGIIALAEWLNDKAFFRHLGTGLMVILFTAVVANLGVIPASTPATPVYDAVFSYVAPLSIFLILLNVHLGSLKKAGKPMLLMFVLGAIATTAGALIAMWALQGKAHIGEWYYAIGGMYTGTYIGGSMNFNAVALNYGISQQGSLFSAATVSDNIISALWVIATLALPQFLNKRFPGPATPERFAAGEEAHHPHLSVRENVAPFDLALLLLISMAGVKVSAWLHDLIPFIPTIIWLTTIALVLAQIPIVHRLKGHKLLGLLGIYLFLSVIGAYCDVPALLEDGKLAAVLMGFVTIMVVVHGLIIYVIGALLKQDWDVISIASQANIGGTATAMALARSLNRSELILPGILVGALGNALGTYVGILVAEFMRHSGWF